MILATALLFLFQTASAPPGPNQAATAAPAPAAAQPDAKADSSPPELKLLHVKRIFVDSFGDDPISKQVQTFIITDLTDSNRFVVTENKDKADAILRGSGLEKTSQEFHSHSEGTAISSAAGHHHSSLSGSGSVDGSWVNGTGSLSGSSSVQGSSSGGFAASAAAINDASASTETINDARIAVRLVDQDGDVIWAASEESNNSKYKSVTADVADRVVHKLLKKIEMLEKQGGSSTGTQAP